MADTWDCQVFHFLRSPGRFGGSSILICLDDAILMGRNTGYSIDTACSSSFAAIQLACSALRAKECDTAVAGGLNVMTCPDLYAGLSRAQLGNLAVVQK